MVIESTYKDYFFLTRKVYSIALWSRNSFFKRSILLIIWWSITTSVIYFSLNYLVNHSEKSGDSYVNNLEYTNDKNKLNYALDMVELCVNSKDKNKELYCKQSVHLYEKVIRKQDETHGEHLISISAYEYIGAEIKRYLRSLEYKKLVQNKPRNLYSIVLDTLFSQLGLTVFLSLLFIILSFPIFFFLKASKNNI
jgi:hypothetical protein